MRLDLEQNFERATFVSANNSIVYLPSPKTGELLSRHPQLILIRDGFYNNLILTPDKWEGGPLKENWEEQSPQEREMH